MYTETNRIYGVVTRNGGGFVWFAAGSVEKFSWYRALQLLWNLQLLGLHPERTSYNMVCSSCERDEQPGQLGVPKRWPDFRLLASEIGRVYQQQQLYASIHISTFSRFDKRESFLLTFKVDGKNQVGMRRRWFQTWLCFHYATVPCHNWWHTTLAT